MRKPEEIKKGLECISDDACGVCSECPYRRAEVCQDHVAADALEYIQKLEERCERLPRTAEILNDALKEYQRREEEDDA